MAVRITVDRAEFTQAESNGEVWGQYLYQKPKLSVYVLLGLEREYIQRDGDDLRANYKLFTNCYVEYYRPMNDYELKDVYKSDENVTVIICC